MPYPIIPPHIFFCVSPAYGRRRGIRRITRRVHGLLNIDFRTSARRIEHDNQGRRHASPPLQADITVIIIAREEAMPANPTWPLPKGRGHLL